MVGRGLISPSDSNSKGKKMPKNKEIKMVKVIVRRGISMGKDGPKKAGDEMVVPETTFRLLSKNKLYSLEEGDAGIDGRDFKKSCEAKKSAEAKAEKEKSEKEKTDRTEYEAWKKEKAKAGK